MSTIQRVDPEHAEDAVASDSDPDSDFKPLTREEARQWRTSQPSFSLWRLVAVQGLVALCACAVAWLFTQSSAVAMSVLYGAASVVLPSALMAYGLTSSALGRLLAGYAQGAFAGFLFWEGVKVVLVVAMLWSAPRMVPGLNWLGLLAGLVLVLKVYWFGFWIQARRANVNG